MFDPYAALGVSRGATHDEIKRSFRKLTQQFHPDKNPGDDSAEERFKQVSQAYEVLGDEDKRKLYDEFGDASLTQGFDAERARAYKNARSGFSGFHGNAGFQNYGDAQNTSFDDLLSQLFGGGRVSGDPFGRRAGPPRGRDIAGEIRVSFTDSLTGVTVPLRVDGADGNSKTLDVHVPAGITDGGKLRLRGQGNPGSPPGDILLTVRVSSHAYLTRDGNNIRMKLPVTAYEAYAGAAVDVPTPTGTITLTLPAGSQSGATLRVRGKGVQTKSPGDLLVTLDVHLPAPGDPELANVLARLQTGYNPRAGM